MTQTASLACCTAVLFLSASAPATEPAAPKPLDSGLKPDDVEKRRYLEYVRECVGLLIAHGTDRYGKVHSPLLMNILDVRTRSCPRDPLKLDEAFRVTRRGRRGPGGGNLYLDQPAIRAMYALGRITGDGQYATFADKCLRHTLTRLVDDKGFFWWGYHRHYDAHRDVRTGHSGNHHEIHIQQIAWPELYRVDPQAVVREIEAIWKWHVIDKTTGEVNRHGDGRRGCDFAMSAGEILCAMAFLHAKTGGRQWLERARRVADRYWGLRHPKTDLIANRPNAGKGRFDGAHFDTSVTGLYCHSLLKAFEWTKDAAFRDQAVAYLKAYARRGYDARAGRFWGSLRLDGAPVPGPRATGGYQGYEPRGHVDMWQPYIAGYEHPLYTAQAYAYAYQLTRDAPLLAAADKWARCIRAAWPPRACLAESWYGHYARTWAPHGTYAGHYGRAISFFAHLHSLTGEGAHRDFARRIAREAVAKLYYRGLFRGHPCKPYYESADGVGYLLLALLQLDQALAETPTVRLTFENW